MLKKISKKSEVIFILKHIRSEDKKELTALYGDNWYRETVKMLKEKDFLVLYGRDYVGNVVPVAMGGFYELHDETCKIACVWLLSTYFISKNKALFWKELKGQIYSALQKYDILYNYIYKSNSQAKSWLKKLNFKFDNPSPEGLNVRDNFEFFYLNTERKNNVYN